MQHLVIQTKISVEDIVNGVTNVIRSCFRDRILSIYVSGSLNRAEITPTSDIDITVVFRDRMSDAEYNQFMQLRQGLQVLSPLRLDMWSEAEEKLRDRPANKALRSAMCIYGEDFFPSLPHQAIEHFAVRYIHKSIHYMRVLRGRPQPNPAPLNYPQADDDYLGYTQFADFEGIQSFTSGVRIIVNMLTACLSARLAIAHKLEATTKQESIDLYATHINDQWADYSRELVTFIKSHLRYELPSNAEDKSTLQALLQRLPDFENDMLHHYKPIILENLQSKDRRRLKLALVALMNVQLDDADIKTAVASITEFDDMDLLQTVKELNLP